MSNLALSPAGTERFVLWQVSLLDAQIVWSSSDGNRPSWTVGSTAAPDVHRGDPAPAIMNTCRARRTTTPSSRKERENWLIPMI